ncbi:hypothetical protein G6Z35_14400 [Clostridium perfringens]|uniref:hypothetical protein n=1 Tax=Clostridium perfringens TaxID=1502 RepID=UPI0013E2E839|nr:hypothetical protein [Clostridium perfringens]MDK0660198.1 hypothetical protein [Clostridium perfringens]MDK0695938.1 hypothetical protein [Clostridium perfringens]NGT58948.1 hypothetical protein [Clostridium perfringens]NGU13971.1 hypothetical protein [Clostridium perfringens]QUD74618.1 hypothetical protein KB552_15540 [Clostridium perfringens]
MKNNGVFNGINILEIGILSVLFENGIVDPKEFKKALFKKVDEECPERDRQAAKDFISTKIENALKLKRE